VCNSWAVEGAIYVAGGFVVSHWLIADPRVRGGVGCYSVRWA
jgi:hypothetical protein